MLRRLEGIRKMLVKTLEIGVIMAMGALVVVVVWQVFTRYVLKRPSAWSEEAARMLLIWAALLGAAVGFARQAHLGLDYLVEKLDPKSKTLVAIFVHALTGLFAGTVMIYGGLRIVAATLATNQVSPAMGIRWGYVYLALPLSGVVILVYSIEMVLKKLVELGRGEPQRQ